MKHKKIKLGVTMFAILAISGLTSAQEADRKGADHEPPTVEEIFKKLDTNEDGKISKKEVKGPLKDDFAKIDTDKDGFISKKELEKAPKPKRRKPSRNN